MKDLSQNVAIFGRIQKTAEILKSNAKICKIRKNQLGNLVDTFGFVFFFSPGLPEGSTTTHGPENRVSLLENRSFHERHSFYLYFSSANPSKSAKIEPRWLGKLPKVRPRLPERYPKVTPTLPQRYPNVHRRSSVVSHQGALAGPLGRPSRPSRAS